MSMETPIEGGDIVFHYRLPSSCFWGSIVSSFGLGGLGLYVSFTSEPPEIFMAFLSGLFLLLGIIIVPRLYHDRYRSDGVLIVEKDNIRIPNHYYSQLRVIYFDDIQDVLIRYRKGFSQPKAVILHLKSGKKYSFLVDAFFDEIDFEECVVLIYNRVNHKDHDILYY